MKYNITGRGITITDGLRAAVIDKISKTERYFHEDTEAAITLSVEKGRKKIEITIPVKGTIIRAEQVSDDMYVSIDLVEETLERQIKKYKRKIKERQQAGKTVYLDYIEDEPEIDDKVQIVRTKKFAIKPMDAEEACIQMDLLGHNFYVFCNAETEEVNVVYKRNDGSYGLIEPTFE